MAALLAFGMGRASTDSHHHHGDPPTSVADELRVARDALDAGDPKHAAFHLASALSIDARDGAALELADAVLDAAPDPTALIDVSGDAPYFGFVAFDARARWKAGDRDRAIEVLAGVVGFKPEIGYATWLPAMLPGVTAKAAAVAVQRTGERIAGAGPTAQAEILAAGEAAIAAFPDEDRVGCMHARNLREAGRVDAALELLAALDARHTSYLTGVFLATTRKIAGDLEGAVARLEALCAQFPDEDSIFLDLGDNRLDLGRYGAAAEAYAAVAARVPHHDWAYPSLLYARYLDTDDLACREQLEDAALVDGADRARRLAHLASPYLGYLASTHESVINIGAQLLREDKLAGLKSMAQSSIEAPSAFAALRRVIEQRGGSITLTTKPPATGDGPDPRLPRGAVAFATWTYDGIDATPALPQPAAPVTAAIHALADQRFDGRGWLADAAAIATDAALGPDPIRAVIAAMLHPSTPPGWASPLHWPWRFQVAGALILANLDPERRELALTTLIDGPIDWLSTAGLIAAARLCDRDPAFVPTATRWLEAAAAAPVSPIAFMCLVEPAVELLTQLPGASPSQRAQRRSRRAELARAAAAE
jgi:hypothetical protein